MIDQADEGGEIGCRIEKLSRMNIWRRLASEVSDRSKHKPQKRRLNHDKKFPSAAVGIVVTSKLNGPHDYRHLIEDGTLEVLK